MLTHQRVHEPRIRHSNTTDVNAKVGLRGEDHALDAGCQKGQITENVDHRGTGVGAAERGDLAANPGDELHLHCQAHLRLSVAEHVRWGLKELVAGQLDVAIDEDPLPWHEDVVEDGQRVALVEAARQRGVVGAGLGRGVWSARVELQPRCADWHREGQRVVFVARLLRDHAADEQLVGQNGAGAELLRAAQDDTAVLFGDHADLDEGI